MPQRATASTLCANAPGSTGRRLRRPLPLLAQSVPRRSRPSLLLVQLFPRRARPLVLLARLVTPS